VEDINVFKEIGKQVRHDYFTPIDNENLRFLLLSDLSWRRMAMRVIGVIPARFGSTRMEGKPLVKIRGKSMIERVYEQAKKAQSIDELYIATDDERIRREAESFGAKVIMTSREHTCGTDRIAEAIQHLEGEIVVNIQGDEPLIEPTALDAVVKPMIADTSIQIATLITPIGNESEYQNPNIVKVAKDKYNFALYFSRCPIPYSREGDRTGVFKHIGVYAYRRDFLLTFAKMEQTRCEKMEKLEQLRPLENGYKIKLVETSYNPISVDVPEDIVKVEKALEEKT
jgi:3-deoxy-manno-octulosonate cytidylyltransferase (CMP-KDO synthetase)